MYPNDPFTAYEIAIQHLRDFLGATHPRYDEVLIYQQRLQENIALTRLHGDTEQRRADRADIIAQINAPARATGGPGLVLDTPTAQNLCATLPLDRLPDHAPLPAGSRMPLSRNPLFVGRAADLQKLAAALTGGETVAIRQIAAATGLGGIGKTNLATEFVHRYGQFFAGGVFWLSFADPGSIPAEIAACGSAGGLNLPGITGLELPDQVRRVQQAWPYLERALAIFETLLGNEHPHTKVVRGNLQDLSSQRWTITHHPPILHPTRCRCAAM